MCSHSCNKLNLHSPYNASLPLTCTSDLLFVGMMIVLTCTLSLDSNCIYGVKDDISHRYCFELSERENSGFVMLEIAVDSH
jgi:hypothetical protein